MYSHRRTEDQWREVVADLDASGLTQEVFVRKKGLKVGTFRSWVYRIREASKVPRFVELVKGTTSVGKKHSSRTTLLSASSGPQQEQGQDRPASTPHSRTSCDTNPTAKHERLQAGRVDGGDFV